MMAFPGISLENAVHKTCEKLGKSNDSESENEKKTALVRQGQGKSNTQLAVLHSDNVNH